MIEYCRFQDRQRRSHNLKHYTSYANHNEKNAPYR
jgi:hypothetical protein